MPALVYKIVYSKRRTVSLIIQRDGSLVVRAPKQVGAAEIARLVEKRGDWIEKHQKQVLSRQPAARRFQEGGRFLFLGREFPLVVTREFRSRLYFADAFHISAHKLHRARALFEQWYKDKAREIITERARFYSGAMGARFRVINIKSGKTRWGSCSTSGSINFSWRLVMAPPEILDYVVVHELAHTIHHNHSAQFWKLVGQYYPPFRQAKAWLNKHGHTLMI